MDDSPRNRRFRVGFIHTGLIDLHVRHISTRLQVAFSAFCVCFLGDLASQQFANALSLMARRNDHDIEKIVAVRVSPDLGLGFSLFGLPDIITL